MAQRVRLFFLPKFLSSHRKKIFFNSQPVGEWQIAKWRSYFSYFFEIIRATIFRRYKAKRVLCEMSINFMKFILNNTISFHFHPINKNLSQFFIFSCLILYFCVASSHSYEEQPATLLCFWMCLWLLNKHHIHNIHKLLLLLWSEKWVEIFCKFSL